MSIISASISDQSWNPGIRPIWWTRPALLKVCRGPNRSLAFGPCSRCRLLPENSDRTLNVHICSIITTWWFPVAIRGMHCYTAPYSFSIGNRQNDQICHFTQQKVHIYMTSYLARGYRIQRLSKQNSHSLGGENSIRQCHGVNRISIHSAAEYLS